MDKHQIKKNDFDRTDISIIEALRKNPRESLRNISNSLKKQKQHISPETIRRRISKLNESIVFQPILNFNTLGLENAILLIKIHGGKEARKKVIKKLERSNSYNDIETIGPYDIISFVALKKPDELSKLIDSLKSLPEVENIENLFITKNHDSTSYLINKLKFNF